LSPSQEERELKFAGVALGALRERMVELQAERTGPAAFEENWIFDRGRGELSSRGQVLRLRLDGQGAQLTLKGAARFEETTKVRDELQTRVEEVEQMRAILERLGFRVRRRYQKLREEWRLGAVLVCLDHTPIGDFAEFEGQGAEKLAKRCGLLLEQAETRTYLELYEEYLKANPEAPPDMLFKEKQAPDRG
jgi:predicted adenylyl cyclase CyaB